MPTFDQMAEGVRTRLGDPRANRPSAFQTLNQLCSHARTLLRHRRATGNPWNFNDYVLTVSSSVNTYVIGASDFGQPVAVLSYAPQQPMWIPRLIPFYLPQNMPFDWGLPNNAAWMFIPPDGSQCTAMRCAFYWRNNQAYIELQPTPMMPAQYLIRYLQNVAGTVDDMALTQQPVFNEDSDLLEVRSALSLLPLTEWNSPDDVSEMNYNAARRKDLAMSLSAEERELTRQFEAAALQVTGPRLTQRWSGCLDGYGDPY